ncbi:MAG TPA: hypothetical protein VGD67_09360, partial [Pseudonocardiaceae bacterium]
LGHAVEVTAHLVRHLDPDRAPGSPPARRALRWLDAVVLAELPELRAPGRFARLAAAARDNQAVSLAFIPALAGVAAAFIR